MRNLSSGLVCHLLLLLFVELVVRDSFCLPFDPRSRLAEFSQKIPTATRKSENGDEVIKQYGGVYYPAGFGADPTGKADSYGGLMDAINSAAKAQSGLELLPGVNDLGGVVIDLLGGNYIISQPLRLPPAIGNFLIRAGTLRASSTFPGDRHLIELWAPTSEKLQETNTSVFYPSYEFGNKKEIGENARIFYEGITFQNILFDSSMRGGGLYVIDSARVRVDHCFFIHFTTQGILVQDGQEINISGSFLGQHLEPTQKHYSGTAILLRSNKNAVTDVTIFYVGIGVEVVGQANMLTGIHCYSKALTIKPSVGIVVRAGLSQTRIDNCYMDYMSIYLVDPVQVHISNSYFAEDAKIFLVAGKGQISGLNIVDNMFISYGEDGIYIKTPMMILQGEFTDINQVVIDRNSVAGDTQLKSTVGRLTVLDPDRDKAKTWFVNFSDILLFPNKIDNVQYGLSFPEQGKIFPSYAITDISNNVVVVESDLYVANASLSMIVDQYRY